MPNISIKTYFVLLTVFLPFFSQAQDNSYLELDNNQNILKNNLIEPKKTENLPGKEDVSSFDAKINNFSMLLNDVQIKGNHALTSHYLQKFYKKYLGKNINYTELTDILLSISKEYKKRGYFLSYVLPDKNFINKNTINIRIIEGSIKVQVLNELKENKLLKQYISNIESCKPITKEVYERNIELIKMLPGLDYVSKAQLNKQSLQNGSSEILNIYILGEQNNVEGLLFLDNTNKLRKQGPISIWNINKLNNLFNYNEVIKVALETSGAFDKKSDLQVGLHLPLNANSLALSTTIGRRSLITYQDVAILKNDNSASVLYEQGVRSKTEYIDFKLSNTPVLYFNKKLTTSVGFSFDRLTNQKIINNQSVNQKENNGYKRPKFYIEGNYYLRDKFKGDNYFNIKFSTTNTSSNDKNKTDKNKAKKYNILSFDYTRRDSFKKDFVTVLQLESQYTKSSVSMQDKFLYGGGTYGKAYYVPTISGDNGINASFKLAKLLYNKKNKQIYLISPYVYIDTGIVKNKKDASKYKASSLGAGVEVYMRNGFRVNYSANNQISKPMNLKPQNKKLNHIVTIIASYNF